MIMLQFLEIRNTVSDYKRIYSDDKAILVKIYEIWMHLYVNQLVSIYFGTNKMTQENKF